MIYYLYILYKNIYTYVVTITKTTEAFSDSKSINSTDNIHCPQCKQTRNKQTQKTKITCHLGMKKTKSSLTT